MPHEIERKFLVEGEFKSLAIKRFTIIQGYLSSVPERSVRIRISDDTACITIKGAGNDSGISRFEWEKEITIAEARALLDICEEGVISKTRFIVPEKSGLEFEIDEFHGDNEGLLIAEVELPTEDHPFEKPDWLGDEVTGKDKYYNAGLSRNPYSTW